MTRQIVAVADTETTGFMASKGHRLVEVAFSLFDYQTRAKLRDYSLQINPMRDIPADASRVHGIFIEDLIEAPKWEAVAPFVNKVLNASTLLVCHNIGFDAPFLGEELIRVGETPPDIKTFCTMANGRWATANGKVPKLAELAWALNIEYDPALAHRATYDTDVTAACLWAGIDAGRIKLPI